MAPFGTVVLVDLLLVTVTPMPVIGTITIATATTSSATTASSSVVATRIITAASATVIIEGSPVAAETPIVPPVALKISRWVVSLTAMRTGA